MGEYLKRLVGDMSGDAARGERTTVRLVDWVMLNTLKKHWKALRASPPGRRFKDRYERVGRSGKSHWVGRFAIVLAAIVSFAIAVVLTVIPGPAVVFFLVSAALLASISEPVARWLDAAELWLRSRWLPLRAWYRRRFRAAKGSERVVGK